MTTAQSTTIQAYQLRKGGTPARMADEHARVFAENCRENCRENEEIGDEEYFEDFKVLAVMPVRIEDIEDIEDNAGHRWSRTGYDD